MNIKFATFTVNEKSINIDRDELSYATGRGISLGPELYARIKTIYKILGLIWIKSDTVGIRERCFWRKLILKRDISRNQKTCKIPLHANSW